MKYQKIFIVILIPVIIQNCSSSESNISEVNSQIVSIELDSNYWQPDKLILDDSIIDISSLNQLYRFDEERVLVWNIENNALRFDGDYLDIQCWWIELNDSLLFPIDTTQYFKPDRYDGRSYHIPKVIRPDSTFQAGYEDLNGEVIITQLVISKKTSVNLLEQTDSNLKNPIKM